LDERLYALQDPNWNVVALSNTSGTIVERYRYTAYGYPTFQSPTFIQRTHSFYDWETLYCSYRWDAEVLWYQVRHRVLLPYVGRWNRRDPIEADINLYRGFGNDPLLYTDPMGLRDIVAGAGDDLRTTIKDFFNGGESNVWRFPSGHSVSYRFKAHPAFGWIWGCYNELYKFCKQYPQKKKTWDLKNLSYVATTSDFKNDLDTGWGSLTEGLKHSDFGIQVVGSFTYSVKMVVDCCARKKSLTIELHNTWSIGSLTRNPITRQPITNSKLLNPVEVVVVIEEDDTFGKELP
jgi:RHS repeat-associated protein